jgi:hypothetical protein
VEELDNQLDKRNSNTRRASIQDERHNNIKELLSFSASDKVKMDHKASNVGAHWRFKIQNPRFLFALGQGLVSSQDLWIWKTVCAVPPHHIVPKHHFHPNSAFYRDE